MTDDRWLIPFLAGFVAGFLSLALFVAAILWVGDQKWVRQELDAHCAILDREGRDTKGFCHY